MGSKKVPFFDVLTESAAAGSNDLSTDRVKSGRFYCIQRVAVENQTTAYTDLRLLTAGTGGEMLLEEIDHPQAASLYWTSDPIYLIEGQYLVARLSGCTASDVLKCYLSGYWTATEEGSYA